jgi:ABC-type antimicrobial peptide transport system permease subunit/AraC-like DNA-binding protein
LTILNSYTFHITLYDLAFLGAIFIGLTFALLLWFTKNVNRSANRFIALALATMILWMIRLLAIDIRLETYLPHWDQLPLQFLLALGPLLYFYVLKITRPQYKLGWKDLLHFSPLLLEQGIFAFEISASARTGAATYATQTFRQLNPVLQLLIFLSIITYLYKSNKLIHNFYRRLQPVLMDRSLLEFRWLRRLLAATALLWLLWLSCAAVDYFGYRNQLALQIYYPFYIFFAVINIWTAATAFLRPQAAMVAQTSLPIRPSVPAELRAKGAWLKKAMEANLYYQDPELSLPLLAEKLRLHPHELSRVINVALKKNFNDFINEYRIRDVVSKMQDPAYDHITLLGIAFEAGFNSKATFNRTFKQMTGKSPAEFKNNLEKEGSSYHLRPWSRSAAVISKQQTTSMWPEMKLNRKYMFNNYLKIAWRNLLRNKASSFINIGGLAVGMAVAMLIGLWIWDELSFNKYHQNYDRIAQVMKNRTVNGMIHTNDGLPIPLADELKLNYGSHFKYLVLSSRPNSHVLAAGDKRFSKKGSFMEASAPEMLTLKMLRGTRAGLKEPGSILLSHTLAQSLFGDSDPMGKLVTLDTKIGVKVTGVYEDLPYNSSFTDVTFIAPWDLYAAQYDWPKQAKGNWGYNPFQIFVQAAGQENLAAISEKIKNTYTTKFGTFAGDPKLFLHPMSRWHLHSEFKNGVNEGGRARYVWLFGIIGAFVLLLACINFMNLSTARSETRAKEVGIRKAMGSLRGQLIGQFFFESFLATGFACLLSILLVQLSLPYFNVLADKQMTILWGNSLFWASTGAFILLTGLVAGSYPAFYLSSFKPITILKGVFKAGRHAALPRRVLVVLQFAISISLIIGTVIVFRQVQYARNRSVGYGREGLLMLETATSSLHDHFAAFSDELLKTGAVTAVAESNSPATGVWDNRSGYEWEGKDPGLIADFAAIAITKSFGKTVGWQLKEGRDFSDSFLSDSSGIILNETAVKFTGLKHPVGATISIGGYAMHVIGVIKDMLMESPYEPVKQTMYYLTTEKGPVVNFKIKPDLNADQALTSIAAVFKKYDPKEPFDYRFVDEEYAKKFESEERIGQLAWFFAALAIFISCLGLFGMASFMAEQRVKEIGVRKILGASVFELWRLLSKEFVIMVIISLFIAIPVTSWVMYNWLQNYTYRTGLSWWVFAVSGLGALVITMLTVSYQSIKAALANPVKSLRTE